MEDTKAGSGAGGVTHGEVTRRGARGEVAKGEEVKFGAVRAGQTGEVFAEGHGGMRKRLC